MAEVIAASAVGGLVARIATHPVDTAKTRIQFNEGAANRSFLQELSRLLRKEPVRNWYKGFGFAATVSIPALSLYLYTYEECKRALVASTTWPYGSDAAATHLASASLAEVGCRRCVDALWDLAHPNFR